MVPMQVPGGPELLIVGLIVLLFMAVAIGIVGGIIYLGRRRDGTPSRERRIEELERRVAELESARDSSTDSAGTANREEH